MKKLIALIMTLLIMCMASACGNISLRTFIDYGDSISNISSEAATPTSALEAFKQANAKSKELSKDHPLGLDMNGKMSMSVSGQSQNITISGTGVVNASNNQGAMNMSVNMSSLGVAMNTSWYSDGAQYYIMMLGKTYKMSLDENVKNNILNSETDFDSENMLAESEEITPAENGGYDYKIVSKIDSLDQKSINSLLKSFNMSNTSANIKAMAISGNIDADGILASQNIVMSMDTVVSGVTVPMDISMNYKYDYKEEGFQITVPEGLDIQNAIAADSSILNGATAA